MDEDLDAAARRQLAEQTSLSDVYLEQLYTFGRPDRNPARRMVAVAYFALIPITSGSAGVPALRRCPRWAAVDEPPPLVLDHGEIVAVARRRLAAKLLYSTIALQLMPERFTLSEGAGGPRNHPGRTVGQAQFPQARTGDGSHRSHRRAGAARRPTAGPFGIEPCTLARLS